MIPANRLVIVSMTVWFLWLRRSPSWMRASPVSVGSMELVAAFIKPSTAKKVAVSWASKRELRYPRLVAVIGEDRGHRSDKGAGRPRYADVHICNKPIKPDAIQKEAGAEERFFGPVAAVGDGEAQNDRSVDTRRVQRSDRFAGWYGGMRGRGS